MSQYRLVTTQAGNFNEKINALSEDGWYLDSVMNQGNHFYTVMVKYSNRDEEEELSDSDQLWKEQYELGERVAIVEGALALKVKKGQQDPAPKKTPVA